MLKHLRLLKGLDFEWHLNPILSVGILNGFRRIENHFVQNHLKTGMSLILIPTSFQFIGCARASGHTDGVVTQRHQRSQIQGN